MSTIPPILLFPGSHRSSPAEPAAVTIPIVDLRGRLPTRPGARPYFPRAYAADPRRPTEAELQASLDCIAGGTYHYTASSPWGSPWGIAEYQVGPTAQEDFPAIAYTLIVALSGVVYLCHDLWARTWQSGAVVDGVARNRSHVGICYIGDYQPYPAQLRGLAIATVFCEQQLGCQLPTEGHGDVYATPCPGPTWPDWRPAVEAHIAQLRSGGYRFELVEVE